MWHLINQLVETPSLCLYCIFACFKAWVLLTWWLFYIYIACALLYNESCYHVCSYIFAYIYMYLFYMAACCMITFFLYDACLVVMFICDIDMLTILIDSLVCFSIWLFLLYDYLALLDMYILILVYLIHIGVIDSLYCILSCYIPILFILFLA